MTPQRTCGLIERLELYERSAKIISDPDSHRLFPIVNEHPANVAVARQEIIRPLAAAGIESTDSVGECIDLPGLAVAVSENVIGRFPRQRLLPFSDRLRRGIEHTDAVAAVLGKP